MAEHGVEVGRRIEGIPTRDAACTAGAGCLCSGLMGSYRIPPGVRGLLSDACEAAGRWCAESGGSPAGDAGHSVPILAWCCPGGRDGCAGDITCLPIA